MYRRQLHRIRVYLGMKQEALASDVGVSQQEISKIEKQDEIEDGDVYKRQSILRTIDCMEEWEGRLSFLCKNSNFRVVYQ